MRTIKKTVLVTGGAGFIGSHLSEALISEGLSVRVLDDLSSGHLSNLEEVRSSVEFIEGSVLDAECVQRAADGCSAIFHLAAVVSVLRSIAEPEMTHQVNTTGSLNIMEAARQTGARVIFSSSAAVYGNSEDVPLREITTPSPMSPYGAQKLLGEHYLASYYASHRVESVSLRYFNVYGTRQDPASPYSGVISIFAGKAKDNNPIVIYGDGSQTRDFVYVQDVVRANLAALHAPDVQSEVVNVATGQGTSVRTLADLTISSMDSSSAIIFRDSRPGDIMHSIGDPCYAQQRLDYHTETQLRNGLRQLIDRQ